MKEEINHVSKNVLRYWHVDGLAEITMGAMFVLFGLYQLGSLYLPSGSPWSILYGFGLPLMFIVFALTARRVVSGLKTRLTYPRTGFVAYRRPPTRRRLVILTAGSVLSLVLVSLLVFLQIEIQSWMPFLDGVVLGILLLFIGQGLARFYILSTGSFLLGALLSLSHTGGNLGHAAFYGTAGLALILSGAATLWLYLRRHQPVEEA